MPEGRASRPTPTRSEPARGVQPTGRVNAPRLEAARATCVGDVMRTRFMALAPSDSLLEAERLMRIARVRFLPVVEEGSLVGVLSNRDLLESSILSGKAPASPESLGRFLLETRVETLMKTEPVAVTHDTTLRAAAELLLDLGEGCLPVIASPGPAPRLLGILTETDLLRAAYEPRAAAGAIGEGSRSGGRRGGVPQ